MSATDIDAHDAVKRAVERAVDEYTEAISAVDTGFLNPNTMGIGESEIAEYYSKNHNERTHQAKIELTKTEDAKFQAEVLGVKELQ
ncbi:hypothetical protein SAMN05216388_100327 [Halorientalis persicus]|uniref:Uncharacterized protein n=1 Tax=Halorientalis persicus TaxID=1367881 RepID=A0A1H8G926_9EURY|nr:hypothetical protein [Halorientalis persicus]SEN40254.1 hypothetical protein SAMN05216388_100327 [Halorientalis persicus]